jgi:hypothetical protein
MGWVVALPRKRDPVPLVKEAGSAPGTVCTSAENLATTGIRSPDRATRSESLCRLSYRGPLHSKDLEDLTFWRR